eukprot:176531_1
MATVEQCEHCFTNASNTYEKKLFKCGFSGCRLNSKSLCFACGTTSHQNNPKVFNHEFAQDFIYNKQIQAQNKKTIMKYDTTTSNANNATKKAVGMGGLMSVGAYQVQMHGTLTQFGKNVTCGIQVALCIYECGYELKRYHDGTISGKECTRLIARSITANSAAAGGAIGGAFVGGAMGGLPGCIIGGIIGGVGGDNLSRLVFDKIWEKEDKIWEKEDEKDQENDINEALKIFGFIKLNMRNVLKAAEFNAEELQKRYYDYALKSHPDTKYGTPEKFKEVLKNYNILLGVLQRKN